MKNVFDQYDQSENRLTHALFCALHHDRRFLRSFLKRYANDLKLDHRHLKVDEQFIPTIQASHRKRSCRASLPDGIVSDRHGRALIVESKIASPLLSDQLRRHTEGLRRQGYEKVSGLAIVASPHSITTEGWTSAYWTELYGCLASNLEPSVWVQELKTYLEILEAQMIEQDTLGDRALTKFNGIPFSKDHPYTYREAKRLLKLLRSKILNSKKFVRQLEIDITDKGRPAITEGTSVWDYLAIRGRPKGKPFNAYPHFNISIGPTLARALIIVPHKVEGSIASQIRAASLEELHHAVESTVGVFDTQFRHKAEGVKPILGLYQRHFRSQRSQGVLDGVVEFDLRTIVKARSRRDSLPKLQPEWLEAVQNVLRHKASNMEVQIGCEFHYDKCKGINGPDADELFVSGWKTAMAFFRGLGVSL